MSRLIVNFPLRVAVRRFSVSGFVALTLLLAACGGSSGGSENSRLDSKSPYTEKPSGGDSTAGAGDGGTDVGNANDDTTQDSDTDTPDTNAGTDAPTANPGDDTVVDGGGEAEPDNGVEKPTTGDDSGLIEGIVSEVSGAVRLEWERPEFRENGEYLEGEEIGGYELRYRRLGEEQFQTVIVSDGWKDEYELGKLVGSYQFTIAAFDTNGLYSEFVSLSPVTGLLGSL